MTEGSDDVVARYAARLMAVKASRDAFVDDATLTAIAKDLGMSDADLAAVADVAAAHMARADGYRAHGRLDDAIVELDHAVDLQPRSVAALFALADALGARANANGNDVDRARARALAKAVLDVDPGHQPSFALLNALDGKKKKPMRGPRFFVAVAAAVGAVFAPFAIVGAVILSRDHVPPIEKRKPRGTPVALPVSTDVDVDHTGKFDLPLTLIDDANSQGLRLEVRSAVLSRYPDSAFFEVRALVHNDKDALVSEVDWRLDLVDKDGVVVTTQKTSAPASHEAALRKGDSAPLDLLVPTTSKATAARLTATRSTSEPASSRPASGEPAWPASPEVELHWEGAKPAGVDVVVRERSRSLGKPNFGMEPFFEATWEFENTGTVPLETMEVELRAFDADGKRLALKNIIGTGSQYLTSKASHPVVRPGEVRLLRMTKQVPKETQKTELWVVSPERFSDHAVRTPDRWPLVKSSQRSRRRRRGGHRL